MWLEVFLGTFFLVLYIYKSSKNKDFWYKRGIPNTDECIEGNAKESIHDVSLRLYNQFEGVPFFGSWTFFGNPVLVIRNDFDLIKSIWIKDFDHFSMAHQMVPNNRLRGQQPNTKSLPLTIYNLHMEMSGKI